MSEHNGMLIQVDGTSNNSLAFFFGLCLFIHFMDEVAGSSSIFFLLKYGIG